jgi:PAS domain S-box-containing protein
MPEPWLPSETFRALIDAAPDALLVVDDKGLIRLVNDHVLQLFGYDAAELIGRPVEKLVPMRFRAGHVRYRQGYFKEPRIRAAGAGRDLFGVRKDGTEFPIDVRLWPHETTNGMVVTAWVRDISERKRREFAAANTARFIEQIVENIPHMVFVKDAKELRFVQLNRAGEQLLGFPRTDLIGKNDYDFFPKDQADFFVAKDRATLAGRTIVDIPEETIRVKSGETRILHTKKIPILEGDEPAFLLGISEDITEKKQLEESRRSLLVEQVARQAAVQGESAALEQARRMRILSAASGELIQARFERGAVLETIAWHAVELLGDSCAIYLGDPSELVARVFAHRDPHARLLGERQIVGVKGVGSERITRVFREGTPILLPVTLPDRVAATSSAHFQSYLERYPTYSLIAVPLRALDRTIGVIAMARNTPGHPYTEADLDVIVDLVNRGALSLDNAHLYEDLRLAVQVRDDFVAIASHELKTPLAALMMQVQGLLRAGQKGYSVTGAVERLDKAVASGRRLERLINQLLDVSRISADRLQVELEPVDLAELARDVVHRFATDRSGPDSNVSLATRGELNGRWDRSRMDQILTNLVDNAVKYGEGKPVAVEVSEDRGEVTIQVSDHGIGIDAEHQQRIFQRFERAVNARQYGGFGLGLWITRQIVEACGGQIQVRSERDVGSTFTVRFPRNPVPADARIH